MPHVALAAANRPSASGTVELPASTPGRRRPSASAGVFALLVALLSGVLVGFGPAAPAAAGEPEVIHSLVNEARAANGLAPLSRNASLDAVAAAWAQKMADRGVLEHNPNVGAQISAGWTRWGENIAQGHRTGAAMQQGWMDSPGHYKNIMGQFTDIGVAFLQADGTTWGVQVFATYPGGAPGGGAAAAPKPTATAPKAQSDPAPRTVERSASPAPSTDSNADRNATAAGGTDANAKQTTSEQKKQAAAEQKAAQKKKAAERKAAEKKKAAERDSRSAKRHSGEDDAVPAAAGSVPTATAVPRADSAAVPQSTSATRPLAAPTDPAVLVGLAIALIVALVLLSPTLRSRILPGRRGNRHR